MTKAVAYMRYSSHNQNDTSIERQLEMIEEYCERHEIELVDQYVDIARSGKYDNRPSFQRLISDAKGSREWDTVLVYNLSRYSRNSNNANYYEEVFKDYDIHLISVTQPFGDDISGYLSRKMTYLTDEMYSLTNSMVTHDSMMSKAKKGSHCGGIAPLGYDIDENKRLVINEDEAETVKKIFKMFLMDYSYSKMAKTLNDEGRRTKVGSRFTKHSFSDLLKNEKYTGLYIWNRGKAKNSKGKRNGHTSKPLDQQVRVEDGCPQIITPEQFEAVQEKLRSRANGSAESKRRYHYMLSGLKLLKCASCGSYMIGTARTSRGRHYTTYLCPNRKRGICATKEIHTENLDIMVAGQIMRDLNKRKDLADISDRVKHDAGYDRLQRKKRGIEKALNGVVKALEATYSERLVARLQELEAEADAVQQEIDSYPVIADSITEENRKAVCRKLGKYLRESEDPEVKFYLASVIQEVLVSNEDVKIKMKIA